MSEPRIPIGTEVVLLKDDGKCYPYLIGSIGRVVENKWAERWRGKVYDYLVDFGDLTLSCAFDELGIAVGAPDVDEYHDPFADIARELIEIHDRKGRDYGTTGDPYANVRMSEAFGIPAWIGVGIRMNDKMKRLQTAANQYLESGEVRLQHEGLIDIARDFAVYGVILEIMIREWIEAGNEDKSEGRL